MDDFQTHFARIADTEPADWSRVIDINLTGTYLGIRALASSMRKAGGGAIVNISSGAGMSGAFGLGAYVASKCGVRGLTKNSRARTRARQDPRELHPPRYDPHDDGGTAERRGGDGCVSKGPGDSAHRRA